MLCSFPLPSSHHSTKKKEGTQHLHCSWFYWKINMDSNLYLMNKQHNNYYYTFSGCVHLWWTFLLEVAVLLAFLRRWFMEGVSVWDGSLWWKFLFSMAFLLVFFEVVVCGRISVSGVRSCWKFRIHLFEEMVYRSSFCLIWQFVVEVFVCNGSSACFIWGGGLKQNFCLRCQFMV